MGVSETPAHGLEPPLFIAEAVKSHLVVSPPSRRPMLRGLLVAASGAALALFPIGCRGTPSRSSAAPPNIILLSLDTLRADRLGSYGYERATSPELDRLASHGVRFADTIAESSWTLPSHMTLMTGLQPGAHGVTVSSRKLAQGVPLLAQLLRGKGYRTFGITAGGWVRGSFGFARGFEKYEDSDRALDSTLELAKQRIEDLGPQNPYFLFLHTYDLHCPYAPPEPYQTIFGARPPDEGHVYAALYCMKTKLGPDLMQYVSDQYDGSVRAADDLLGDFFTWFRERGGFRDTVVAVLSDHGEEFGEHGDIGHGKSLYIETLRVPLIIVAPGFAPRVVRGRVGLADVAPTLLELAGVSAPPMQGRSLVPSMRGEHRADGAGTVFSELDQIHILRSAIRGNYHVILDEQNRAQLFDLSRDPWEAEAVAMNAEGIALQKALESYISRTVPVAAPEKESIPPAVAERLRALGYGAESEPRARDKTKTGKLIDAARVGDVSTVSELLRQGADVNGRDAVGLTALIAAAAADRIDVVQLLLRHGAEVDARDEGGGSALLRAAEGGHVDVVEALLAGGARLEDPRATPLMAAAEHGRLTVLTILIDHGADLDAADEAGRTALHYAAARGEVEAVRLLLARGARRLADAQGRTPLMTAAANGRAETLRALVAAGADPDTKDEAGMSPLHVAVAAGAAPAVIETLLDLGAEVDARRPDGWTPLLLAASAHDGLEVVQVLLDHGADVNAKGAAGETPLFQAASESRLQIVELLLARGAHVNARCSEGNPLLAATVDGGVEVARVLLEHGADVNAVDEERNTPLLIAASDDDERLTSLLLAHGADLDATNEDGETAFTITDETEILRLLHQAERARQKPSAHPPS